MYRLPAHHETVPLADFNSLTNQLAQKIKLPTNTLIGLSTGGLHTADGLGRRLNVPTDQWVGLPVEETPSHHYHTTNDLVQLGDSPHWFGRSVGVVDDSSNRGLLLNEVTRDLGNSNVLQSLYSAALLTNETFTLAPDYIGDWHNGNPPDFFWTDPYRPQSFPHGEDVIGPVEFCHHLNTLIGRLIARNCRPNALLGLSHDGFPVVTALAKRLRLKGWQVGGLPVGQSTTGGAEDFWHNKELADIGEDFTGKRVLVVSAYSDTEPVAREIADRIRGRGGKAHTAALLHTTGKGDRPDHIVGNATKRRPWHWQTAQA